MQDKGLDFKHKEVINIKDGKRLGYVQDVCADLETGVITSIIVPGSNKIINIFAGNNDIVIPWQNVKCIGNDFLRIGSVSLSSPCVPLIWQEHLF